MKKIAIVLGRLGTHGPSLIRLQIAKELLKRGYSVDLVLGAAPVGFACDFPPNIAIHVLNAERPRDFIIKLKSYLSSETPDGVIGSSWPFSVSTIIAVKLFLRTARVAISEHADFRTNIELSGEFGRKDAWLIKNFSRYIYNRADKVVGVSNGVVEGLIKVAGVKRSTTTTIYNPLRSFENNSLFPTREKSLLEEFWSDGSVKLLAVGRLAPEKDYSVMLRALAVIKNCYKYRLVIVGGGRLLKELEAEAAQLGISDLVYFSGSSNFVHEYYRRADLYLMSSSSEGFGNVIVEALSHGLPVVSTNCQSGPAEILDFGKYGELVPVGDSVAMATAIEKTVANPVDENKQKMRAKYFSVENTTDQYLSALFGPE